MAIPVTCRCGQAFAAQPHLAGQQVACPACGRPLVIPRGAGASSPANPIVVTCRCGRGFQAAPHLAGQRVACPACGQALDVPLANTTPSPALPASTRPQSGGSSVVTASLAPTPAAKILPSL